MRPGRPAIISPVNREEKTEAYRIITARLERHFAETRDPVARMATAAALLNRYLPHVFWSGFYLLADGELTIGPYQGAPACVVLEKHRGVCWAAIDRDETINVPNVHEFEGHIQCEGPSNSEIAVPFRGPGGEVAGVLHLDSGDFDAFDELDIRAIERLARMFDVGDDSA